jgi:ribosome biogenesis ATPase
LAHAIAGELNIPFLKISAPEIVSGMSGDSEKRIRNLFKEAVELAPSIIFIDEIDAIVVKREESNREMEVRMVAQILTCMDGK